MKRKTLAGVIASICIVCFTGCPDYSHLRPVPDYENMSDGGVESESKPAE